MSATLDQLWDDLLTAGLVGTDRRPFAPPPDGPARLLGNVLGQRHRDDPARAWLAAAGALAVLRLAGGQPVRIPLAEEATCPPDAWPRCRHAAAQRLARMLSGEFSECLPEWLAVSAAHRRRAPEEHLPELLDWGRTRPEARTVLLAVIGERGRWLAKQNERWAYAAHGPLPAPEAGFDELLEQWEVGSKAERLSLLEQVRANDPVAGLALLKHSWSHETAEDRLAGLKRLAMGLSRADEPFLEEALRDRSYPVRQAASRLLAQLPESGLCQRLRQLARPLLRLEGGPRGSRKRGAAAGPSMRLVVNLPEANPVDSTRKGLPAKEAERAQWLATILAGVPPMDWCHALKQSPAQLVMLARANVYDFALVEGWAAAAASFGDVEWAEALLRERLPELDTAALGSLLRVLPPERREALLFGALESVERLAQRQPAVRLLQAYAEPWGGRLTRLFIAKLCQEVARRDVPFGPAVELGWLSSAALYWDPALAAEATPLLRAALRQPGGWVNWTHIMESALTLWQFRSELHQELSR
jgi:hypothetical protein